MPQFNGNNIFVKIDTIDVSALFTEVSYEPSNSPTEVTRGASVTHVQRKAGLDDSKLSITLSYEDVPATMAAILLKAKPGNVYPVEFGIEGATAGKPRHVQSFILESSPIKQTIKKDHVTIQLSFSGADAATTDMYNGGIY